MSLKSEGGVKKLVSVLVTCTPVIETSVEAVEAAKVGKDSVKSEVEYPNLAWVPCIYYPITFWKRSVSMLALLDSGSEVNAIHLTFAKQLKLPIRPTHVGV